MRITYTVLLLLLGAVSAAAQTTFSWGTGFVVDEIVQSDGTSEVSPGEGFTMQLGTFGNFTPTENNIDEWAANWIVIDEISQSDSDSNDRFFDFSGTNGAFFGGDTLNSDGTSASSDAAATTLQEGWQVYAWTFDTQTLTEDSEWSLYTQVLAGDCDNCIDQPWTIVDPNSTTLPPNYYLSEADTALWGSINDSSSVGGGDIDTSPSTSHLQTARLGRGNYWDLNGSTAGSAAGGTTATWDSSNKFWNRKADGTRPTKKFKKNSVAVFSAGTDADGTSYTVEKVGDEEVFGLDFENGDVTISHGTNGSITFDRRGKSTVHEVDGVNRYFKDSFINVDTGNTATIETVLAGSEDVIKTGGGTLVMAGSTVSTYSGELTLEDGVWQMSGTGSSPRMDNDIKIDGGTLLISETNPSFDNQFGSNTNIEYEQGLIQLANVDESLGTLNLTLSQDSSIDLTGPSTTSKIYFADSSGENWADSGSFELLIENWDGLPNFGGGTDQIFFGNSASGLTSSQVNRIKFVNPNGVPGIFDAIILSTGEVVPFNPVPEPGTIIAGVSATLLVLGHFYRRRKLKLELAENDPD